MPVVMIIHCRTGVGAKLHDTRRGVREKRNYPLFEGYEVLKDGAGGAYVFSCSSIDFISQ